MLWRSETDGSDSGLRPVADVFVISLESSIFSNGQLTRETVP
jgi:hypothetical protein